MKENEIIERKSELIPFEQKYMTTLVNIKKLVEAKKDLEDKINEIMKQIDEAMIEYDVTSVRTSFLNISKTNDSISCTIDTKLIKEKDPVLYEELLDKYGKTTTRKGSITFRVN